MKLLSAFIYPVKSMRAVQVSAYTLDALGIVGDRRWMVVDSENKFISQRDVPALISIQPALLENGLALDDGASTLKLQLPALSAARRKVTIWKDTFDALDAGDEAAEWLSKRIATPCRLVAFASDVRRTVDTTYAQNAQTGFTDAYPLLIVNEASLDLLNEKLSAPIPMNRFRPNLVVRGAAPWDEERWTRLRIDGIDFEGVKPCARCVAITRDQTTGVQPTGSEPLTLLAQLNTQTLKTGSRGAMFGMNLVHRGQGRISVGANVEVLS